MLPLTKCVYVIWIRKTVKREACSRIITFKFWLKGSFQFWNWESMGNKNALNKTGARGLVSWGDYSNLHFSLHYAISFRMIFLDAHGFLPIGNFFSLCGSSFFHEDLCCIHKWIFSEVSPKTILKCVQFHKSPLTDDTFPVSGNCVMSPLKSSLAKWKQTQNQRGPCTTVHCMPPSVFLFMCVGYGRRMCNVTLAIQPVCRKRCKRNTEQELVILERKCAQSVHH